MLYLDLVWLWLNAQQHLIQKNIPISRNDKSFSIDEIVIYILLTFNIILKI